MTRPSLLFWVCLAGCTTHAAAPDRIPENPPTPLEDREPAKEPVVAPAVKVERAPFTLTRGEVNRTLDAAPGAFLRRIATEVRLKQGRFAGWRIVAFSPRDPVFSDGPLHPGDVIVKVNGHTLERPDDLIELWQAMRSAPSLMVELERDGVASTLRWTIVD